MLLQSDTVPESSQRSRVWDAGAGGWPPAVLLIGSFVAGGCGDGTGYPLRADGSDGGRSAHVAPPGDTSSATAWDAGGGPGLLDPFDNRVTVGCSTSDWAEAPFEQDMLKYLNGLRQAGTACSGSAGELSEPLLESPSLTCAARMHSRTGMEALLAPITEVVLLSDPPEALNLPALVQQVVDEGGYNCLSLLGSQFNFVGIGFVADQDLGFWTIYLGTA